MLGVLKHFFISFRTIPLRPEDYQRFKPELWVQRGHAPGRPVAFNDPDTLRAELELRNNRRRTEEQVEGGPESFNSLPWEEIVFGGEAEGVETQQQEKENRKTKQKRKKSQAGSGNTNNSAGSNNNSSSNHGWFGGSNSHPR